MKATSPFQAASLFAAGLSLLIAFDAHGLLRASELTSEQQAHDDLIRQALPFPQMSKAARSTWREIDEIPCFHPGIMPDVRLMRLIEQYWYAGYSIGLEGGARYALSFDSLLASDYQPRGGPQGCYIYIKLETLPAIFPWPETALPPASVYPTICTSEANATSSWSSKVFCVRRK